MSCIQIVQIEHPDFTKQGFFPSRNNCCLSDSVEIIDTTELYTVLHV